MQLNPPITSAQQRPHANGDGSRNGREHAPEEHRNGIDGQLVGRCLAGESDAWDLLFQQAHPILLESARYLLGPSRRDDDLAEEIASRVWYALLRDNRRALARYDAAENHLGAYLFGVTRREIQQFRRAQRRRFAHESEGGHKSTQCDHAAELETSTLLRDFLAQLNVSEQEFLEDLLLPSGATPKDSSPHAENGKGGLGGNGSAQHQANGNGQACSNGQLSKSGIRQRSRRLRLKLQAFLNQR